MKVILDNTPRTPTVVLDEVPFGSCVRGVDGPMKSSSIYMRTHSASCSSHAMVRLNDGDLYSMDDLEGTTWELADSEVVVHG